MAVTVIRRYSSEPNITNRDDVRMIRYAYGGQDGYIPGYKNEAAVSTKKEDLRQVFKIDTGCLVIQGWEILIDSEMTLAVHPTAIVEYYYVEINLLDESAEIKSTIIKGTDNFEFDPGDDLTENPLGTARMLIAKVTKGSTGLYDIVNYLKPIKTYTEKAQECNAYTDKLKSDLVGGPVQPLYCRVLNNLFHADDTTSIGTAQFLISEAGIYVFVMRYTLDGGTNTLTTVLCIPDLDAYAHAIMPNQMGTVEFNPSNKLVSVKTYGNQKWTFVKMYPIAKIN